MSSSSCCSHHAPWILMFWFSNWLTRFLCFPEPDELQELRLMDSHAPDTCPVCHMPFDKGKKRKLIDSCGHARCYMCMFSYDTCPICESKSMSRIVYILLIHVGLHVYFFENVSGQNGTNIGLPLLIDMVERKLVVKDEMTLRKKVHL